MPRSSTQTRSKPIFTDGAKEAVEDSAQEFELDLLEAAISEALITRGEPIEVTSSDVRKARSRLTRSASPKSVMSRLFWIYRWASGTLAFLSLGYVLLRGYADIPVVYFNQAAPFLIISASIFAGTYLVEDYLKTREERLRNYSEEDLK